MGVEGPGRAPASGPEEKAASAEASIAVLRVVVIAFGVGAYWLWYAPAGLPVLAATISVVALTYAVVVLATRPYLRYPILATSAWTTITEGVLITGWLHATGDAASPFYLLWFVSLIGASFRFDWRSTLLATGLYLAAYAGLAAATGGPAAFTPDFVLRLGYLALSGVAASLWAGESSRVFAERFRLGQQVKEAERDRAVAAERERAAQVLRESEERFRLVAESAPLGIFHTDPRGRVDYANAKWMEIAGCDYRDADAIRRAVHPDDAAPLAVLWRECLRTGTELTAEFRYVHPDGKVVDCWTRATPVFGADGNLTGFVGVVEDTGLRRAAEARAREVQQLTEQSRFKTAFINTAAHELGTPLTPILLQVHLLKKETAALEPQLGRRVQILDRNLERLRDLVRDILDGARLQSSRLALRTVPVTLPDLLEPCVQEIADVAAARGVRVEAGAWPPALVLADANRIHQVVMNLLWNAVKFTPAGGRVELAAGVQGGEAVVRVHDTGIGLRPSDIPRLFQPFVQVHAPGQSPEAGTGLGLYICRGIVEQHGGRAWAESAGPGKGSTFAFTLPLADGALDAQGLDALSASHRSVPANPARTIPSA